MANFDFTVAGIAQKVCVSGSSDRFEIKLVDANGNVLPFYVDSNPVFIGGNAADNNPAALCATIYDDGDYTIIYADNYCGDAAPVFLVVDAPPAGVNDQGCCDGPTYQAITACDADTRTLWAQWHQIENGVVSALQAWSDTGRSCSPLVDPDVLECAPVVGEFFGVTDAAFSQVAFTSLDIDNESCCDLTVTTSAGVYTVKAGKTFGLRLDCAAQLVSVTLKDGVAADCDSSNAQIIYSFKG